jgi:3'(2'), 5'-bisphosphate nucleotidase
MLACFDKVLAQCYNFDDVQVGGEGEKLAGDRLQRELDVATRLAIEAGGVIMGYYGTDVTVEHKERHEPVTEADRAADDLIVAGLQAAFSEDGLLTEESDDDLSRLEKDRVWIVDPLDGTSEFITGTGDFAVQIALTVRGAPVLGVIYQPTERRLLYSVAGHGAYQAHDGRTCRLHVSTERDPARMCLVASRAHYSSFIEAARLALGIGRVNRAGSVGLKVGLVAQAACDLYLATTVSKEWDICAPHAVLLEAGGKLTNLCGEAPAYNQTEVAECRGLAASNGLAHARIVETLAPLLDQTKG